MPVMIESQFDLLINGKVTVRYFSAYAQELKVQEFNSEGAHSWFSRMCAPKILQ